MGSSWLIVLGFVLTCVRFSDARFPGMRLPIYWGVKAQKPAEVEAEPAAGPEREHSRESAQQAGRPQSQQMQPAVGPLPWKYPEDPVDPQNKPPVKFELRQPGKTNPVAVRCGESRIQVEVSQDLLGLGKLIKPEEITLGGCPATDIDKGAHVLVFECDLHSCGSTLVMTESDFIYAFTLVYNPKVSGRSPIIRSQSAAIGLQCHYPRRNSVQSSRPYPAWMAHKDTAVAEKPPQFSLQLMTDDWKSERTSSKFTLRDTVNMQASVSQHIHPPLRVLVDSCVATMTPDPTSEPAHAFIKNHGCLGDRHSSRSRFRLQSQPNKLQFQVEALSLHLLKTIHITCKLKAIPASSAVTIEHKACSFNKQYANILSNLDLCHVFRYVLNNTKLFSRWRGLGGKDQFCACCESSCGMRKVRGLDADTGEQWQAELTLGPIVFD